MCDRILNQILVDCLLYVESNLDRIFVRRNLIKFRSHFDRISLEFWSNFEWILIELWSKTAPGPLLGDPGGPRGAQGRSGASPARSGSVPGAAREHPGSAKRGTFEGSEFEQIQEPKFRSHFEQVEPKNDRILDRLSSIFERILNGNLIMFDNTKIDRILNNFRRNLNKNRERETWTKYRACQQKQGFGRFQGLSISYRISIQYWSIFDRILFEFLSKLDQMSIEFRSIEFRSNFDRILVEFWSNFDRI